MKKWYKGVIKVLYDADEHDDIDISMMALEEYILQSNSWAQIDDIKIGDMYKTHDKVEE